MTLRPVVSGLSNFVKGLSTRVEGGIRGFSDESYVSLGNFLISYSLEVIFVQGTLWL